MAQDIFSFFRPFYPRLWRDRLIRQMVMIYNSNPVRVYRFHDPYKIFTHIFDHYLEEAELIISLIKTLGLNKKKAYLEIGGGLGLVYGYLRHLGFTVDSCEPSLAGFNYFETGQAILKIIGVSDDGWRPYTGLEVRQFKRRFDVIFSSSVIEHISDLKENFLAFKEVLNPKGIMLHYTVNYWLSYEPHFKIWLIPFFPRLTEMFRPQLREHPMWRELNFVNPIKIYFLSRSSGLAVQFLPDQLSATVNRLDSDSEFSRRHFHLKKYLPLLRLLLKAPVFLQTPLVFTLKPKA